MSTAVAQILIQVQNLSTAERMELHRHLVDSIPVSDELTEEDYVAAAAAAFRALDEEEAERAQAR